jgi:formamidopyrimidine-DNA glycosylase
LPEIAEVRRIVDCLNTEYGGHDLLKAEVIGGRFLKEDPGLHLLDFPFQKTVIGCKGKLIYWLLHHYDGHGPISSNYLFIHLAMSGSFGEQQKHSALKFTFDNGDIFFNDPRHFGSIRVSNDPDEFLQKLAALGWDPLQEPRLPTNLIAQLRARNHKKIGEFMMEQGPVSNGTGNYLRAECLYRAKINPLRLIGDLSDQELVSIYQHLIEVMQEAYAHQGASFKTYTDLYGNVGTFYDQFKVYGRKTDPEGNPVAKVKDKNGRMIHWVPAVQV